MDDIISLLAFIFTDLYGYLIEPGLAADKQSYSI